MQLVEPEQLGSLVQPARATFSQTRVKTKVKIPDAPGRYRLVITLHDSTGVAYDAATQAMVRGLLVRVTGPIDASYLVAPAKSAVAGTVFTLPVGVANLGTKPWGSEASGTRRAGDVHPATNAVLVAHWVPLDAALVDGASRGAGAAGGSGAGGAAATPDVSVDLRPGLRPGDTTRVVVNAAAPARPGDYLLMLDVVAPDIGSLAAKGVPPALVRVTVTTGVD